MTGIVTHQLQKDLNGMRNFEFSIFGRDSDANFLTGDITGSTLTALAAGSKLTLLAASLPIPRTITAACTTSAAVASRSITLKVYGRDQFGKALVETLSAISATASQTKAVQSTNVFWWIDAVEVYAISNVQSGDTLVVGCAVTTDVINPENVIYGFPIEIRKASDVLGIRLDEGGTINHKLPSLLTFVPSVHGFTLDATVAPDGGSDRIVTIFGKTSW